MEKRRGPRTDPWGTPNKSVLKSERERERRRERERDRREREREKLIQLYFLTVNILVHRPSYISAVATVLLTTKTFIVKYHYNIIINNIYLWHHIS